MYKIGEFSFLSKTSIKTLRYYEKEGLLLPKYVDSLNNYRYYDTNQLFELNKILNLREIGFSIKDIKVILRDNNMQDMLIKRKEDINGLKNLCDKQLSKIKYILEERKMNNTIVMKNIPSSIVYYKEGIIKDYSELTSFILSSGEECLKSNPNIKCVTPDYCFVNYLDKEYKETNIKVRYSQAVVKEGKSNDTIKFMKLEPVKAVCIMHKGSYSNLTKSYAEVMEYIEKNNYEIIDYPRECYIDGIWNKDNESDYLTEIQVPIK